MSWLFENDLIDLLPAPPPDPWAGNVPPTEDWSASTDSKDADTAFWTFIDTIPPRPGPGGGGTTTNSDVVDDIIVVGGPPPVEYPGFDPNPGGGGGGETGGGGGGDGTNPDRPHDACEDRQADTLADDINDEIARQPDSNRREYGALIWRDDAGNLHRTALVPGTNGNVPFPADSSQLGIDNYSRVVGIVHSHPSEVNVGSEANPNWVPASEGFIHGGDWMAMDGWVSQNSLSTNNFTVYISYQGQTREYDYADNLNPALRNAQDSTGSQESGDYNPGATCP